MGNRATVVYPNATWTEYVYDSLNRLTRLTNRRTDGTVISSYAYTLGPAGHRTRVVDHDGRTVDYSYDALYRLTEERIVEPGGGTTVISYTYDAVGNRLTRTIDGVTASYAYDANNRLLAAGGTIYAYDTNGNLVGRTSAASSLSYEYDFENRLTRAETPGPATSVVEFVYDSQGQRVRTVVDGARVTNYLVDGEHTLAQVLLETDGAGAVLASYVYGDDLISMRRSATVSYFHYDGQFSTRQLTDGLGAVTDSYAYDAFGRLLNASGSTSNNYRYTTDPNLWCDEYPFATTREGGPATATKPRAATKLVPKKEQQRQGGKLRWFYPKCGLVPGHETEGLFSVRPYEHPNGDYKTDWICKRK